MNRLCKDHYKTYKKNWKVSYFGNYECLCQPGTNKFDRPLIVWAKRNENEWSDTIMVDVDAMSPEELMQDGVPDFVKAVFESASGRTHVLCEVSNLNDSTHATAYDQVCSLLGVHADVSCKDLATRGFFVPNRIVYVASYTIAIVLSISKSLVLVNPPTTLRTERTNGIDKNPYIFIKGQRHNWLYEELKKLTREQNCTNGIRNWAFQFIQPDFTRREILSLCMWFEKNFRPYSHAKGTKTGGRKSKYDYYRFLRNCGVAHKRILSDLFLPEGTGKKYRSRYNKEIMARNTPAQAIATAISSLQ